jgi:spore coat protein A, manganese oxidase
MVQPSVVLYFLIVHLSGWRLWCCVAAPLRPELSDPVLQPKFQILAPNALDPSFLYDTKSGFVKVGVGAGLAHTGLVGTDGITAVDTPIWGYGTDADGYTWPGRTFSVRRGETLRVKWVNKIPTDNGYLITGVGDNAKRSVVDTSLHWAYGQLGHDDLHVNTGQEQHEHFTIDMDGTPMVIHLHGGNTDSRFDGHPEAFFSPGFAVKGDQWKAEVYVYENKNAANLWYHDHTLGLTRLNVYSGMVRTIG